MWDTENKTLIGLRESGWLSLDLGVARYTDVSQMKKRGEGILGRENPTCVRPQSQARLAFKN